MSEKIREALWNKFDKVRFNENEEKVIEITFKESGNTWILVNHMHYGGTKYGFKKYYKAIHGDVIKHFKSLDTLAKAIAAGYVA